MKIKTQFFVTMLLFAIILVVAAASAVVTHRQVEDTGEQERIATGIAQGAGELGYLSNDYLIYRESQQLARWHSRFAAFSGQVAVLQADTQEQQVLVANIRANRDRMKAVFDSMSSVPGPLHGNRGTVLDPAFIQVSWSRMAVQTQALAADASRLSQLLHAQMDRLESTRTLLMYVMVGLFGAFLLASYLLTYRRILTSIARLRAGAAIIGSGNLDFTIEERRNDEIGELSLAFNRMAANLKAVTASKADLEREIDERKRAEETLWESEKRYRTLFETMTEGFALHEIICDDGGRPYDYRFLEVNPAFERQTGLKAVDLVGHTLYEVLPQSESLWVDRYGAVALTGEPIRFDQWSEALGRHYEVSAFRTDPGRFAVVFVDITARKLTEKSLAEHAAKLEEINKELESFSYSVSHDLRAPLRAITGFAQMILKKEGERFDEETRRRFDVIRNNAEMMGRLIDDLLAFSRLGRQELAKGSLDMEELIGEVWQELVTINPGREMALKIGQMPAASGDRTLIRQVYGNLLGNAVKFTQERAATVIEAGSYEKDNETVYYVRDNGIGFDMKFYDKLFGVFQRLHSDEEYKGTGIGLALVQRIVHRHGGRVWAEGKVDEGACFSFTLPEKRDGFTKSPNEKEQP